MSPRCVRFSDNARESFHILLFLREEGYIRQYRQPESIDEYERIGKLTSLFCCLSWKTSCFYRLSDVGQPSLVRKWRLSCESFNQCVAQSVHILCVCYVISSLQSTWCGSSRRKLSNKWAASWQNQQNGMCAQRRLRSAWASAQSDQSLRCPHEESLGP